MNNRKSEIHYFFPTPVWSYKLDNFQEINTGLSKYIYNLKKNDPIGLAKSNMHGWHSKEFILKDSIPILYVNAIMPVINEVMNDMMWDIKKQSVKISNMWAIINNKASSNARHIHGNTFMSAAYYIKAPKKSGNIIFYDPRSAPTFSHPNASSVNKLNATSHSIEPQEGLLILFPSYLHHSVDENISDEERIVLSFNINLIKN